MDSPETCFLLIIGGLPDMETLRGDCFGRLIYWNPYAFFSEQAQFNFSAPVE